MKINPNMPDDIRALGWSLADHHIATAHGTRILWRGEKGNETVYGEGYTDAKALDQIRLKIGLLEPVSVEPQTILAQASATGDLEALCEALEATNTEPCKTCGFVWSKCKCDPAVSTCVGCGGKKGSWAKVSTQWGNDQDVWMRCTTCGPNEVELLDFNVTQWWVNELHEAVKGGTSDQLRAFATVLRLLKLIHTKPKEE